MDNNRNQKRAVAFQANKNIKRLRIPSYGNSRVIVPPRSSNVKRAPARIGATLDAPQTIKTQTSVTVLQSYITVGWFTFWAVILLTIFGVTLSGSIWFYINTGVVESNVEDNLIPSRTVAEASFNLTKIIYDQVVNSSLPSSCDNIVV